MNHFIQVSVEELEVILKWRNSGVKPLFPVDKTEPKVYDNLNDLRYSYEGKF